MCAYFNDIFEEERQRYVKSGACEKKSMNSYLNKPAVCCKIMELKRLCISKMIGQPLTFNPLEKES